MKFGLKLAAVSIMALSATAAQASDAWHSYKFWDWDGAYVSAKGGWNQLRDQDAGAVTAEYDSGYTYNAAVGYQAYNNIRGEFEVGFTSADVDTLGGVGASGEAGALTLMGNAYYDFNLANLGMGNVYANMFTPYVGAGIGAAHVNYNDVGVNGASDTSWNFAYQGIAGTAINFTPNVSVTLEYRFLDVVDRGSADFEAHNVLAGVKFKY